jgi:PPOX class probable F420-dependent enzyme
VARPNIALTESEVVEFLHNGTNLQVATIGRDGCPHLTTLWYVVVDGLIAFRSFRKSQRVANLRRDPRLTVLIEDGDSVVNLRGVMIQGRARLVDDRDLVLRLYGEVTEKYEGMRVEPEGWDAVFGAWADNNIAVLVEPVRVATWDHTKWVR